MSIVADSKEISSSDPQYILDKIYETHQDYRIDKPKIEISNTDQYVAKYSPGSNVIKIEQKVLDICEKYDQYGDDALAFIIGHELAHAYQGHLDSNTETSFLAYNKAYSRDFRSKHDVSFKEAEADVFGSFCAYLAGYDIKKVFPDIIDDIYAGYNLTDKILPHYPSKSSRRKSSKDMMLKLDSLVNLYDAGICLSLSGFYLEAAASYDYISKYYNNSEIINSQGVNYLLQALNMSKLNNESFYYPIEIDVNTRLHKAQKTSSTKDLSPRELMKFTFLIDNSLEKFNYALKLDPNKLETYLNIICAYTIDERLKDARDLILNKKLDQLFYNNANSDQRAAYEITKAILLKKSGQIEKANSSLIAIMKTNTENIHDLAQLNLKLQNKTEEIIDIKHPYFPNFNKIVRSRPVRSKPTFINLEDEISICWWTIDNHRYFLIDGDNTILIKETDSLEEDDNCSLKFINKDVIVNACSTSTKIYMKGKTPIVLYYKK